MSFLFSDAKLRQKDHSDKFENTDNFRSIGKNQYLCCL